MSVRFGWVGWVAAGCWLGGCATPPPAQTPSAPAVEVWDVAAGRTIALADLVEALQGMRAVYIGEHHDREEDHHAQAQLLAALHAADPSVGLGFEMFNRPQQAALDRYVGGGIDESAFLEEVDWDANWGFDAEYYAPLWRFAREHRLPVRALNAPREVTRRVARVGLAGLSEDEREALVELDLNQAAHRTMIMEALAAHPGMDDDGRERFYQAQVVWDETMADSVAVAAREEQRSVWVVFAGLMHVWGAHGIPARAARRGVRPFAIVLPLNAEEAEEARAEPNPAADYLWITSGTTSSRRAEGSH